MSCHAYQLELLHACRDYERNIGVRHPKECCGNPEGCRNRNCPGDDQSEEMNNGRIQESEG